MEIVQRGNYLIYFDDVRVDPYVVSWNSNTGLFANETSASVVMYRTDEMDGWKAYLTQVRIFGENPFTKKFTMVFEGEIMNRSWSENKSDMGKVTFQCKGFYHWLDIPVPMGIQNHELINADMRFIYEAQNIDIDEVSSLLMTNADSLMMDKNIEDIIKTLFDKLTIGYYDVSGAETSFAFAHLKSRFKVMVDVLEEFRQAGFLDLFTFTQATQIESFFVYLNQVLTQLMFEFFQDRDGSFRIKTPSWADALLKAQVIDSSLVGNVTGFDDWQNEPTRVLAIGGETQIQSTTPSYAGSGSGETRSIVPMGLYIGNPQDPETEEYYSQRVEIYRQQFGMNPGNIPGGGAVGPSESLGMVEGLQWFDNLTGQKISSNYGQRGGTLHAGTDYPMAEGTSLYNVGTTGTVVSVGSGTERGNYVNIQQTISGAVHEFRYYHLSSHSVSEGQTVSPGELIGKSGNTGDSTGPHLHFEIRKSGTAINAVPFLSNKKAQMTSVGEISAGMAGGVQNIDTEVGGTYIPKDSSSTAAAPSWLSQYTPGAWATYELTSYVAMCESVLKDGRYYAPCIGITATGWDVKDESIDHRVIAVDPSMIPLHSIVEIEGMGLFNAQDTGGLILGLRIDVLKQSYKEALAFGRKNMRVRIIRRGKGGAGEIVPKSQIGANPTGVGSSGNAGFSSPYANVDSPKVVATGFQLRKPSGPGGAQDMGDEKAATSTASKKGVKFPFDKNLYEVPSGADHLSAIIKAKPSGLDANLVAAVIMASSSWREKYSTSSHIGIMGVSKIYAEGMLAGHNMLAASTAIEMSSMFLSEAIAHFGNRVSFGLAAYHLGSFPPVEEASETVGQLDFSKARDHLPVATVSFVDHAMATLAGFADADFIEGDPHLPFGNNNKSDYVEVPDYESAYKPRMSDEESRYKINLIRVQQELIRNDSPVLQTEAALTADELIYRFAKYTMQLHRARTHNVNVSLVTCLPFFRVGMNAWLEPTRKNVVFYVTSVAHQGSFSQGCYTQVNGGFVRDPSSYQDIDESIFVGEKRADSSIYGDTLTQNQMSTLRAELNAMHGKELTGQASEMSILNKMYSSMNEQSEYTTKWNKEYAADDIADQIQKTYQYAPEIVDSRKAIVKQVIEDSEEIFVKKLMFMR